MKNQIQLFIISSSLPHRYFPVSFPVHRNIGDLSGVEVGVRPPEDQFTANCSIWVSKNVQFIFDGNTGGPAYIVLHP